MRPRDIFSQDQMELYSSNYASIRQVGKRVLHRFEEGREAVKMANGLPE